MKNYMKTILSGIQNWTKEEIKDSTANWNQNDSNASNYIKNRTHYNTNVQQEIFPSQTVTIESGQVTSIDFGWSDDGWESVYNNLAIIVFDGVEYTTTYTKDSDEVTYLTWTVNDVNITIIDGVKISTDSSLDGEHTIKAFYLKEEIHQLESKYIPDTIARIADVKPVSLPLFDTWYSFEDGTTIDYIEGYTFNTYYDSLLNHPATQIVIGQDEMDVPIPNGNFAYIANETLTVTHITDSNIYLQLLLPYNNAILLFILSADHIYVRVINIIDGLATEEYVNTSIANLVDSAPETLNTLNELAAAIQENDSVITTLDAAITNKITMPQDVVAGDLLTYDGTNWVRISKADLIAEIIAALPNAEEASF